jgi:hypothetical protein
LDLKYGSNLTILPEYGIYSVYDTAQAPEKIYGVGKI